MCIFLAVFYAVNYLNAGAQSQPQNTESQPQSNPLESLEGPELVIPESPIGTLGLISALAAGFGIFAIMKKRK